MRKLMIMSLGAVVLNFAAGAAMANPVFNVWGYGSTWQAASLDARTVGIQTCLAMGYNGAYVEELQNYDSGGTYISFGLAECF